MHPEEMFGMVWMDGDVAAIDWGDMLPQVERRGPRIFIVGRLHRDMVSIGPIHVRHLRIGDGVVREASANEANAIESINDAAGAPDCQPRTLTWPDLFQTQPW